ncbi:glycoside hydrolase family 43 protein [Catenuloplanes indicus]|uniref:GH43 family beta-xylosidase n=1 Tax=Catenuloplanes indicus TaxID=137267 RepID=A0AAE3W6V1_9ACTN|nr:glycoside hydrolase family 43 protein [Catenuloplanes indicus]MDQ0370958.1 GH43 family beta-xylosidase [Catenuloplanes indicus]
MTSRRNLLLGVTGAGVLTGLGSAAPATARDDRTDAEIYGVPTADPLISQRADPFITPRINGTYYFTGSVPEYDRLIVRKSATLAGLGTAAESVVWRRPATGPMGGHIWAPELHRIDGTWYIYFAAGDADDVFRIRTYVLEFPLADPADPAGWTLRGRLATEWDSFTLDATTFAHRGRRYLVWAQSEPEIAVNSSLYIAPMANPWTLGGKPTRIATPTRDWQIQGFRVNEGPAVLIRNGRVFVTFSASATDARYATGLLTASASADLTRHASWTKTPGPVLTTDEQTRRYGPGHNSFTVAEDGVTDVLVYHARDYRDITGDPLYDPNRHTRVQKLYWHPDGTPLFGIPVGSGGPIVRVSPAGMRRAFIRHDPAAGAVTVPDGPRDLEHTQFRFLPAADGTETIQCVSHPGRYLRVDGGTVTAGEPARFRRQRRAGGGITLQLATEPDLYLRHERGTLVAGTRPGAFTLS